MFDKLMSTVNSRRGHFTSCLSFDPLIYSVEFLISLIQLICAREFEKAVHVASGVASHSNSSCWRLLRFEVERSELRLLSQSGLCSLWSIVIVSGHMRMYHRPLNLRLVCLGMILFGWNRIKKLIQGTLHVLLATC